MSGTCRKSWAALMLLALVLTGCWDRREIEERSNSLATGVDLCAEDEDCELASTRQIGIPGRIPLGRAGGGGGVADTVFVLRSPGRDGPGSARDAQSQLNRTISFGHTRILIWSEAFARQGLADYIDYLRRLPEVRRLMWVAVSEGPAEEILRARPPLDRVPALFLNDMLDDAVKTGRIPEVFFGDFLVRFSNDGEESIAPLIRLAGPDRPQLAGLAVFRGYKMVGKLTPEETVTYMQLRGLRRAAELLRVALPDGKAADIRIYGRQVSHRISGGPKRLHVTVEMELEAELVQLSPELDSTDFRVLSMVERAAGEEVTRRARALVRKLQTEYRADILALGERVRSSKPQVWAAISDWPAVFSEARFQFEPRVQVRRTGMDRL